MCYKFLRELRVLRVLRGELNFFFTLPITFQGVSMKKFLVITLLFLFSIIFMQSCANSNRSIYGVWKLNKSKSTDIVTWRYRLLNLDISKKNETVSIIEKWEHKRYGSTIDTVMFKPDIDTCKTNVKSAIWPGNWYMGVLSKKSSIKTVTGTWKTLDKYLSTVTKLDVHVSQGETTITTTNEYIISNDAKTLTVKETRSSRPTPVLLVFDKIN